jgi:hypothetical protein
VLPVDPAGQQEHCQDGGEPGRPALCGQASAHPARAGQPRPRRRLLTSCRLCAARGTLDTQQYCSPSLSSLPCSSPGCHVRLPCRSLLAHCVSSRITGSPFLPHLLFACPLQIAPFDIDFAVTYKELDFSHMIVSGPRFSCWPATAPCLCLLFMIVQVEQSHPAGMGRERCLIVLIRGANVASVS